MVEDQKKKAISRRTMLSLIAGSACPAVNISAVSAGVLRCSMGPGQSGRTPTELKERPTKVFSEHQLETIGALSETIIPADGHSPGAKAARVEEYIDEIIAVSNESTKKFWAEGLAVIDRMAQVDYLKDFVNCSSDQQTTLLRKVSKNEEHPRTLEERFFVAVKRATVDGYYNSEIGIHKDLEYQGNTPLAEFPGCTHKEHQGK